MAAIAELNKTDSNLKLSALEQVMPFKVLIKTVISQQIFFRGVLNAE